GGCFVLGVQVFSALRDIYGRDTATSISGLCGTRVVLAAPDKDTSEWSARSLGQVEVESLSEGVSYDTPHGGVSLSTRREERPLVLPSEVSRLQNLSGYIKLPGTLPVARIRLNYRSRDRVAERFVPKTAAGSDAVDEQDGTWGAAAESAALAPQARTSGRPPKTDDPAATAQRNGGDGVPAALAAAAASGEARRAGPDRDSQDRGLRAEAGDGEEWLVEEWASAAGPPDGWTGRPQREGGARGGTTVPSGGGGTSAAPGTRADGGDVDGVSPSAAFGVREERRAQDEEDEEDGEDRKSWM
ncbi:MAG: type IV secretion system DNA-binding domain-containing protein, partial [Chromatiales bacterium]|nr:type IV secretion system DNA-binding domain-containing protein [Chromatiales bacterium]